MTLQQQSSFLRLLLLLTIIVVLVQQQCEANSNYVLDQYQGATNVNLKKFSFEKVLVGNEGISRAISLPFEFDFYGRRYKELYVHAHGYIVFGESDCLGGECQRNERLSMEPNVAAFWTELDVSSGSIEYSKMIDEETSEDDGLFIVRWKDKRHQRIEGMISFQVILFRDGNIEFQYESISPSLLQSPRFIGVQQTTDGTRRTKIDVLIPAIAVPVSDIMVTASKRLIAYEEQENQESMNELSKTATMDTRNMNSELAMYQTCEIPDPPTNLHVLEYGLHSTTLAWTPPTTVIGDYHYQINVTVASSFSPEDTELPTFSVEVDGNATSFTVTDLDPFTLYIYFIETISECNETSSIASNLVVQATIHPTPPKTPPFDLVILDVQCTTIGLQWAFFDVAPFNGGSNIIGYTVEFNPSGFPKQGFVVFIPVQPDGTPPTVTLQNLVPATEYEVSIRAVNSIGCGPCVHVILSTLFCFP